MTIDIHKILNGKIASTQHVEDWATAMQQLKPKTEDTQNIAMAFMDAMVRAKWRK